MSDQKVLCMRCRGRKKIFKVGNAYSFTNTGGVEVTCPMCNGDGRIKPLDQAILDLKTESQLSIDNSVVAEIKQKQKRKYTRKIETRDLIDG